MPFEGKDVISILDFTRSDLEHLFEVAIEMRRYAKGHTELLKDKVMASLFFEPSTRTRMSFEASMHRLGGSVIGFADPLVSKMAVGESYHDIIKMADSYSDLIVVRNKIDGHAKFAAEVAEVPVINAGDGTCHHPTQAMIDLYTIWREFGKIDGLNVAIVADLKWNRATNSLIHGLSMFNDVNLTLISPLGPRKEVMDDVRDKNMKINESKNLSDVIHDIDVIYVTRIQKERFPNSAEYERVKGSYIINCKAIAGAKDAMIVLAPLPRIDELPSEVDSTRHARYFQQAANGIPIRMALLSLVLRAVR